MRPDCPHCESQNEPSESRIQIIRRGTFYRKSDGRIVNRFKCNACGRGFSFATFSPRYRQNKRHVNFLLGRLFASGISQRRAAIILKLNRITVVRKFLFLAGEALKNIEKTNAACPVASRIQFDDQETFEHTKMKPLSITLAVEYKTRRILGFEVARMAASGPLAERSRKKYGRRPDERRRARNRLFLKLKNLVLPTALIESDQNPFYPETVRTYFPEATHKTHKGQRGSSTGQGELKRIKFDPLFSLNHTCAMTRANINRLFRKTWCTTKRPDRLFAHLCIYADFHNSKLI
jgi:transposase-like protein